MLSKSLMKILWRVYFFELVSTNFFGSNRYPGSASEKEDFVGLFCINFGVYFLFFY